MRSVASLTQKKSKNNTKRILSFIKWVLTLLVTIITCLVLIDVAAAERGYAGALGGEFFLMPIPGYLTYKLFDFLFDGINEL